MTPTPHPTAFLARIRLNPRNRAVARDLRDATQMHRTLMRLVPDDLGDSPRLRSGLLYRIETTPDTTTVLLQATAPLDDKALPAEYGHIEIKDLSTMFAALRPDLAVRYRITVNPSRRERLPLEQKNQRGKVIPLSGPDADQWWTRRAEEAGLRLKTLLPIPVESARRRGNPTTPLRHNLIRYDGTATVAEPLALTNALLTGIGRGKPYGAGLLTLAPAAT
ncbi:type I-E CRISPR-associated protein Cas6/Cse3/CasE [Streptomyces sp. NPDC058279]|uniref:type I-E CRISPR-associated protein Cas6/Cse3/CasE n=1 Tax=Streptomyces sp. NPDC058279 TaxID=3346418 RepID=UPI0036E3C346